MQVFVVEDPVSDGEGMQYVQGKVRIEGLHELHRTVSRVSTRGQISQVCRDILTSGDERRLRRAADKS